ncbi:MAG: DHHA1 domain-containing protein, partial [bacterium]|nr:DHHA1 domain-containing protein [bacterium]
KDAIALINPKLKTNKYPFDGLAGVGVAFKLICALQKHLPDKIPEGREKWLLDLVALGTVCDAVDLIDENRLLVKYGLVVMGKTKRAGLQALAKVAGINLDQIDSRSLGFIFGPRLNAAGRIEHANAALKLLLTNDQHEAFKIAQKLDKLNRQRQADTEKITKEALTQAKQYPDDKILVLADKHWSHGIVGIVASRISESFYKPAIILQIEGDSAKGSARSVASFSIIEAIASTKKYLEQFGGHQFAAGVRLKTASIDKFRTAVNRYAKENLKDKNKIKNLEIDLVLADKLINLDSLARLVALEPFGNGNVEPHFLSSLKLAEYRLVGKDSKHVKLTFTGEAGPVEGIAFSCAERFNGVKAGEIFDIVYKMKINNWREIQNVQIEVVDFKLSSPDLNSGK